jgi:hypothetical protein
MHLIIIVVVVVGGGLEQPNSNWLPTDAKISQQLRALQ